MAAHRRAICARYPWHHSGHRSYCGGLSFLNRSPTLTRQTEYAGLRLGMSPDEVMYTKGYPPTVLEQPKAGKLGGNYFDQFNSVIETTKLPTGKRVQVYLERQSRTIKAASTSSSTRMGRQSFLSGVTPTIAQDAVRYSLEFSMMVIRSKK